MSRFENSYLAESVGYNSGHARGINEGLEIGKQKGYSDGWNDAVSQANEGLAKKDQTIRMLDERCVNIHSSLMSEIEKLKDANENLKRRAASMEQAASLHKEQAQSLRAEYEEMFKAFFGVVAIARPAMKAVARLPLAERAEIFDQFCDQAIQLQSREYVVQNKYPSSQPLILKYLPIANQVFNQTHKQLQQQEAEPKAEPAN